MSAALVLAMVLAVDGATLVHPNIFEPTEMGSEAVCLGVAACIEAKGSGARGECGCLMDAVRLNTKNGLRPPNNNATPEQQARCRALMLKQPAHGPRERGKTGT